MNKAELIEAIADHADLTKADAGRALDAFCEAITAAMKTGEDRQEPIDRRDIEIAASKSVGFKPGKALKDAVN